MYPVTTKYSEDPEIRHARNMLLTTLDLVCSQSPVSKQHV